MSHNAYPVRKRHSTEPRKEQTTYAAQGMPPHDMVGGSIREVDDSE